MFTAPGRAESVTLQARLLGCLAKKRCIFWWHFLVHKIFKSKCKLSLMSNLYVRFYAMCAASAWSKQCILVHFVFASTLRCLLPDWQYKQKNSATHYKRFCNFLSKNILPFFPNLLSPDQNMFDIFWTVFCTVCHALTLIKFLLNKNLIYSDQI